MANQRNSNVIWWIIGAIVVVLVVIFFIFGSSGEAPVDGVTGDEPAVEAPADDGMGTDDGLTEPDTGIEPAPGDDETLPDSDQDTAPLE